MTEDEIMEEIAKCRKSPAYFHNKYCIYEGKNMNEKCKH